MSFLCQNSDCPNPKVPHGIPQVLMVDQTRERVYTNMVAEIEESYRDGRERKVEKTTSGTEIVREIRLCPTCSGVEAPKHPTEDIRGLVAIGLGMQAHARVCKKPILSDCPHCSMNVKRFLSLPPHVINEILSDRQALKPRFSFALSALDNAVERANQAEKSKRAKVDFEASAKLLGAYEKRGGGL